MQKLLKMKTVLVVSAALVLSGCALWPQMKADKKLKPKAQEQDIVSNPLKRNIPCITDNYQVARECAELTFMEISDLLASTGDFDRGAAYAALGVATAAGSVIAFNGGSTALKGLAVASGSLLGLNSLVNTEQQRAILKKGLNDMLCYITVADSVHKLTVDKNSSGSVTSSWHKMVDGNSIDLKPDNLLRNSTNIYETMHRISQISYYSGLITSITQVYNAIGSQADIASQLSKATIEKRAELRASLASLNPKVDAVLNDQRNRIVDMAGKIVVGRAAIIKQSENPTPPDAPPTQGRAEFMQMMTQLQDVKELSQYVITETSAVSSAFGNCVDAATNEVLNR